MGSVAKKLVKGSVLRSITLVSTILVGLFMLPFMVHSLGDDQYGIWVLVGAIIGFYGLLDVGLGSAITRFIVRAMHGNNKENDVNIALSSSIFLFSGVGLLSLVITFLIIIAVPSFTETEANVSIIQLLIGILGLKVAVIFPLASFDGVLIAKYRFDVLSYIRLFSLTFRTTLIVLFVSYGYGIVAVATVTAIDALVVSINKVYFAKKLFPELRVSTSLISFEKLKEYYHYGKYTYITTIAGRIRFSIDDLVVGAFVGASAVTHYTIAVALIRYFSESMESALGVISPVLNKYHKLEQWDKLREVFFVATELSAMMSVLIGGLLIIFGESFINIWMGEEYNDSYMVVLILCSAFIIAQAQRPSVAVLYAIAKHKYFAKITSIEAVMNVLISIVLVQFIGIYGVALGTAIPMLFTKLIFQPLYTCRQLDVSISKYFYKVAKYFAVGLVLFGAVYMLLSTVKIESYFELIGAGAITTFIYIMVNLRYIFSDKTTLYLNDIVPTRLKFLLRRVP